jgi:hypothetical protein
MPGFEGTWTIEYHWVKGEILIKDTVVIKDLGPDGYLFSISHPEEDPWSFIASPGPDGRSFSHVEGLKGVRIVFDSATEPKTIFMGPLGSQIERWPSSPLAKPAQPNDMGTFTGTKG